MYWYLVCRENFVGDEAWRIVKKVEIDLNGDKKGRAVVTI